MEDMTNAEVVMLEGPTPAGLQNLGVESEDESDMRLHEASGKGDEKTVHQLLKTEQMLMQKVGMMRRRYSVQPVRDMRRW